MDGEITYETDTTMRQKAILMHYSCFGINIILLLFIALSCEVDYRVSGDFIYENTSPYSIEVISEHSFILSPQETYTISESGEGSKNVSPENYVPPLGSGVVVYENIKCDTLFTGPKAGRGEGPLGIQNYQVRKIGDRQYEFTYQFTMEDYNNAEDCN